MPVGSKTPFKQGFWLYSSSGTAGHDHGTRQSWLALPKHQMGIQETPHFPPAPTPTRIGASVYLQLSAGRDAL